MLRFFNVDSSLSTANLLFSFECCFYRRGSFPQLDQWVATCYFLLNYGYRKLLRYGIVRVEYLLAIFF